MALDNIVKILSEFCTVVIDDKSKSIKACKLEEEGVVTVLTSCVAIKNYDQNHPERITCIILKNINKITIFYVVVNNRNINFRNAMRFWYNRKLVDTSVECSICFKTFGQVKQIIPCVHCNSILCLSCYQNITNEDGEVSTCPVCRQVSIIGDDFGVPHENEISLPIVASAQHPIDQFCEILRKLDGEIMIIARIGRAFIESNPIMMSTMSRTNRYIDGSLKLKEIRTILKKIHAKYAKSGGLSFYIVRKTFKIDVTSNKPIKEVSRFQLTESSLYQYNNNAWIVVFNIDGYHLAKTEYIKPHVFQLPDHVMKIMEEVKQLKQETTISITSEDGEESMNYDMDSNGEITTTHHDMMIAYVSLLLTSEQWIYLISRLHLDERRSNIVCHKFNMDCSMRMNPNDSKKIIRLNLDELNKSRIINTYL